MPKMTNNSKNNAPETNPKHAVQLGYHDYEEAVEDRTVSGIREIVRNCQNFFDRVEELLSRSGDELSPKEKFYSRLLKRETKFCLKWKDHQGYLFAEVSFLHGLQTSLPKFFGNEDILRLVRRIYLQ